MALPRKLKMFGVYLDGIEHAGEVTELTLPKLAIKGDGFRAGGMDASVKTDQGMEDLEIEITAGGLVRNAIKAFGKSKVDATMLRFAGAYQREDTGEVDSVEVVVRGRIFELDFGNQKAGDDTSMKIKIPLAYYKLSVNGDVDVEIDILNRIRIFGGIDQLAEQRKAAGL